MRPTFLVQRLKKPNQKNIVNSFEWKSGILCGGMSSEAYKILNQIFRFDYMGSSEFEFGAVPRVLDSIIGYFNRGEGVSGVVTILGLSVYYLCFKLEEDEIKKRILALSTDEYLGYKHTKEAIRFNEALASRLPENTTPEKTVIYLSYKDYIGWIEMDNQFMFFLDKEAFEKFKKCIEKE